MTQAAPENWESGEFMDGEHQWASPPQSWPPPPPRNPTWSDQPQLKLISPDEASPNPATAAGPTPRRTPGLTRPSATSDLDSELQAAREELHALHELLEELPTIFERKFQHRLKAALQEQRRLLGENEELQRNLAAALPEGATPVRPPAPRLLLPPALERAGSLGQTLRQVLRRNRDEAPGDQELRASDASPVEFITPEPVAESPGESLPLSPDDDGRPRAA